MSFPAKSSIHRFRRMTGIDFSNVPDTIYLDVHQAKWLGQQLIKAAEDIEKFPTMRESEFLDAVYEPPAPCTQ